VVVIRTQEPLAWSNTQYFPPTQLALWNQDTNNLMLEYDGMSGTVVKWVPPQPLVSYFDPVVGAPGLHWVTTAKQVPTGFIAEDTLGYLLKIWQPDAHALYSCLAGDDHFISVDSGCEGQKVMGIEGFAYASPPPQVTTVPLYRCRVDGGHDVSIQPDCGGHQVEGMLGYAIARQ
jgi:hypothetical protein